MIDAKRLAELMEPEMLAALADFIETWCGRLKQREAESGMHDHLLRSEEDALDSVAAVLREVASKQEAPARCAVKDCGKEAQTAPLCGTHIKDFMPHITSRADGAPVISKEPMPPPIIDDEA